MKRWITAALLALPFLLPVQSQAGSTGGSIGKQDKSISGASPPPPVSNENSTRNSERKASLPSTIRLNEHAPVGNFFITLRKTGSNTYRGTWSHGFVSKFTVTEFTSASLKMERQDDPALGTVSGHYVGRRSGNSADGKASISNGASVTWDSSW